MPTFIHDSGYDGVLLPGDDLENNVKRVEVQGAYAAVAASQTAAVCGSVGSAGDLLTSLVVSVATPATSTVGIKDGSGSSIPIVPANTPIGVYTVTINAVSRVGGWSITTGAGVSVLASGRFT